MIKQGGGEEYGKDFSNFCVDYFICLIVTCVYAELGK